MTESDRRREDRRPCGLCCTRIEKLGVTFGRRVIIEDVDLHIHCGELTAIIGPNGAGKTTLLKAMLGEVPHGGEMRFLDADGRRTSHPRIGYVPQKLDFDRAAPVAVRDLFAAALARRPAASGAGAGLVGRAGRALRRVGAEALLASRLGDLSGGELQRVLLALALEPLPDLLLLDEPVTGVDARGMELFYGIVSSLRRENDLSVILVSHDLPLVARHADRIVYLDRTVRRVGPPAEVFADDEVRRIFGRIVIAAPETGPAGVVPSEHA